MIHSFTHSLAAREAEESEEEASVEEEEEVSCDVAVAVSESCDIAVLTNLNVKGKTKDGGSICGFID